MSISEEDAKLVGTAIANKIVAPIRGAPVSGRPWKTIQTKRNSSMKRKAIPKGWEKQQEERKQKEIVKRMQFEMQEEKRIAKEEKKKELEERKKRKEENEKRAEVMQMVSAAKVKRMKKKQLKSLRKVGSNISGSTVKRRKGGKKAMLLHFSLLALVAVLLWTTANLHSPTSGRVESESLQSTWVLFIAALLSPNPPSPPLSFALLSIAAIPTLSIAAFHFRLVNPVLAFVACVAPAVVALAQVSSAGLKGRKDHVRLFLKLGPAVGCAYFAVGVNNIVEGLAFTYGPNPLPMPAEIIAGIVGLGSVGVASLAFLGRYEVVGSTGGKNESGEEKEAAATSSFGIKSIMILVAPVMLVGQSLIMYPQFSRTEIAKPTPRGQHILAKKYSTTGHISIAQDPSMFNNIGIRVMRCDHSLLGGIYLAEGYKGDSVYGSFYFPAFITGFSKKPVTRASEFTILNIGLGIGVAPKALLEAHPKSVVDVVDLDPVVLSYAVDYFEFPNTTRTRFHATDGRAFLERAEAATYDYIIHDVFTNGAVGSRLVSIEAIKETRRVLKEDGVLAVNFVGRVTSLATRSLMRTLKEVYPYVECYLEGKDVLAEKDGFYNMVFFAGASELVWNKERVLNPRDGVVNRKKKTTSDGGSMGWTRSSMVDLFEEVKYTGAWEDGGVLLTDQGIRGRERKLLEEEAKISREGHFKVMVEQFGFEFWLMY